MSMRGCVTGRTAGGAGAERMGKKGIHEIYMLYTSLLVNNWDGRGFLFLLRIGRRAITFIPTRGYSIGFISHPCFPSLFGGRGSAEHLFL
jgi:hypothetical protein